MDVTVAHRFGGTNHTCPVSLLLLLPLITTVVPRFDALRSLLHIRGLCVTKFGVWFSCDSISMTTADTWPDQMTPSHVIQSTMQILHRPTFSVGLRHWVNLFLVSWLLLELYGDEDVVQSLNVCVPRSFLRQSTQQCWTEGVGHLASDCARPAQGPTEKGNGRLS